jgi:Carbohydrate binding domain
MRLKKYIGIFILFFGLLFAKSSLAYSSIASDPASCGTDAYSQTCVGANNYVCGVNPGNNVVSCAASTSLTPPATSNPVESGTVTTNGGYMIDCYAFDSAAPYCNNNGQFVCYQNSTCNSANKQTICSFTNWATKSSYCGSCKTAYTDCSGTCTLKDTVPSGCTTYDYCTHSCTLCNSGYDLVSGVCYTSVKLGLDSVTATFLKNSSAPLLSILSGGFVGINTTTPKAALSVSGGNIFVNDSAITSGTPNAAITKSYLDSALSAYSSSNSLWQLSGNNLFASSTSWNVGIGTNNPSQKLTITGGNIALDFTKGIVVPGYTRTNLISSVYENNIDKTYIGIPGSTNGAMYVFNDGSVGIGTTSPAAALDIFSKVKLTSGGTIYNTDNSRYLDMTGILSDSLKISGNIYTTAGLFKSDAAGSNYMLGNLGIGTTTPAYKLDVYGTGAFTGDLYINKSNPIFNINAITGEPLIKFIHTGAGNFQMGPIGSSFIFKNYEVNSANWDFQNMDSSVIASFATARSYVNSSLGIGTTTPDAKLNVNGTFHVTGALNSVVLDKLTGTGNRIVMADASGSLYATSSSIATGLPVGTAGQTLRSDGTNWLANSVLYNDGTNIGIGITNPASKLSVSSVAYTDVPTATILDLGGTAATSAMGQSEILKMIRTRSGVSYSQAAAFTLGRYMVSGANPKTRLDINLRDLAGNGSDAEVSVMTLQSNGNVGIGTTAPRAKLDIWGNSNGGRVDSLVLSNNGAADNSATAIYMGYQESGLGFYGTRILQQGYPSASRSSDLLFQIHGSPGDNSDTSWVTPLMIQRDTGNVGIGTTSPAAALDIFSKVKLTSGGTIYNTDNSRYLDMTGILSDSLKISGNIYTTAGLFKSDAAGSNYMLGNLGIGTSVPGYKLDVQGGQINASGGLCIGGDCRTFWNQIGTANLMNNSGRFTNVNGWTTNGATFSVDSSVTYGGYNTMKIVGQNGISNNTIMRLKANTTYTISALVRGSSNLSGSADTHLHIQSWTDENTTNVHQETSVKYDQDITTNWKVIYQTFTTPTSASATYVRMYFYPLAASYTLNVAYVKLEQGNLYSDWTIPTDEIGTASSVSGTNSYIPKFTSSNTIGNSIMYDNGTAIGIGTTSPAAALDIFSKVKLTSGGTIYNTDNSRYLDMTGTLTDSLKISGNIYTTAGLFKSDAAGSNYMLGNLGIGTNNPVAKLDIQGGNLYVGSNATSNGLQYKINVYSYDNNAQQIGSLGADYADNQRTVHLYGSANTSQIKIDSSASNGNIILYPGTGNVGIGTTNPLARLSLIANGASEIVGTAHSSVLRLSGGALGGSIGNELLLSSTGYTTGNSVSLGVRGYRFANGSDYSTAGIIMGLDVDNTARNNNGYIALSPSGAIGIGTTGPDAKLNVNGTFHVTGALNSVVLDKLTGTGNRIVMADASGSLYATSSSIATGLPVGTAGQTLRSNGTNWLANSILYNDGSYIGIGTTAPRATLEVAANDGVNASIVAGNVIEVAGLSDVAQGADITITGGTLVSGGPTAKNGKGYWDITSFPSTITFNTRGWWTYAGISFTAANVHNYPAGGGAKLPANFLVEASSDGVTWGTVDDVTGYTSALYYKNNVYGGSGKYIRITATAPQSGESTAKLANVQITNTQRAGKNPFSLSAEGSAIFLGGNVGLSNNNPGSLLTVGSGSNALNFTSGGTFYNSDNSKWLRFDNLLTDSLKVQGNIYTTAGLFKSDAAGSNYMLGSLGIGTTSPNYKLDVSGAVNIINGYSDPSAETGFRLKLSDNGGINNDTGIGVSGALGSENLWFNNGTPIGDIKFLFGTSGEKVTFKSSGSVGIATTTPDAKLQVNGSTHVSGAFSSIVFDKLATDGAGTVMADASGALYTSQTSGIGRFRALTATSTGSQGGYTGANAKCNTAYSGSHVCTAGEILNTINTGHTADIPNTTGVWVTSGAPAYFANVNDCLGWTDTAASYGTIWIKNSADGYGSIGLCGGTGYPIACCK